MANLSGYDSEATGFDCVSETKRQVAAGTSQTTEFKQMGTSSQTSSSKDIACMAYPEDFHPAQQEPAGLNDFLNRVVPAMMEQLDQNSDFIGYSSDSDEEEAITAKLLQEIQVKDASGSGDHGASILGVTWSCGGNSLAFSIGAMQHETWCENSGLIKIFSYKRSEEKFVHNFDLTEKDCVTVLKYHPSVPALLAYGTASGEVVICNLKNGSMDEKVLLTSPSGCHGSRRVSALQWADPTLANIFLMMQITSKGKRRAAADQVLFSAGSDGTINAWQLNPNNQVFENILCYTIDGNQNLAPEITCFDFPKSYPLRPAEEKVSDVFVVGTKTGKLFLCKIKAGTQGVVDPVHGVLDAHATCVLDLAFSGHKPYVFVSLSMDSELRLYDVNQGSPLKIVCLNHPVSSMSWISSGAMALALGLCGGEESLRVYNMSTGVMLPVTGLAGGEVTCLAVDQFGSCRIAGGDSGGTVRVWELPMRRLRYADDLEF